MIIIFYIHCIAAQLVCRIQSIQLLITNNIEYMYVNDNLVKNFIEKSLQFLT